MANHSNQACRIWALVLSLTVHLALVFGAGIRGGSPRDLEPRPAMPAKNLKVALIEQSPVSHVRAAGPDKHGSKSQELPAKLSGTGGPAVKMSPAIFEIPVPQEPYYFKLGELEEKPRVLADVSSDLAHHLNGELPQSGILRLFINERGEIDQVVVDEAAFSEANQRTVREAFAKMKFVPGKIAGNPVKSELKIEVTLEDIVAMPYSK